MTANTGPIRPAGRPEAPGGAAVHLATDKPASLTGARGLLQDEKLIFEFGGWDKTGVDMPEPDEGADLDASDLGDLVRAEPIGLPGLSEPETVRHYVRLSQKNHAIDLALYPLGSCTMKHNPRLNERMARLPGFADIHPLQPLSTVQGALELMDELSHWLVTLTGMTSVALSPKAGAHGELCGLLAIRAAHEARGDARRKSLGAYLRPRHQPRHRRPGRLCGGGDRPDAGRPGGPERPRGQARLGGRGHHGHQPQHLRPVRERDRGDRTPDA